MVMRAGGRLRLGDGVLRPYTVARMGGVPIRLNPSLALTCLAVAFLSVRLAAPFVGAQMPAPGLTVGLTAALLYGGSIFLHELSHLVALLHYGVPVEHVTLSAWGGVTRAARRPETPRADFVVAAAGPACTLLLALAGGCLGCALIRTANPELLSACAILAGINLLTLLPALVPVWPADGGYMLRAVAWKLSGDAAGATRFACYQSVALIGVLFFTGVLSLLRPFLPGGGGVAGILIVAAIVLSPNARGAVATLRRTRAAARETGPGQAGALPMPATAPLH